MITLNLSATARAVLENLLQASPLEADDAAASRNTIRRILAGQACPTSSIRWWRVAVEVLDFAVEYGRPPTLRTSEARLANWVKHQNRRRRREHDSFELAFLQIIPGWTWDARAAQRRDRLEELAAFVEANQRMPVRHRPGTEDGLARWMSKVLHDVKDERRLGIARYDLYRALGAEKGGMIWDI